MSTDPAVRKVDGVELPSAGRGSSTRTTRASAVARHMMFTKVRGRLHEFSGAIHVDEDPTKSWAEATIKAASIDTNAADRDDHLRSPDFLDAETFPEITFKSTKLSSRNKGRFEVTGDLTIRGETRPVTLDVDFHGVATDPWGQAKAAFTATGKLQREDWGMTWNQALEAGGVLVSKSLDLEIEAQTILQS